MLEELSDFEADVESTTGMARPGSIYICYCIKIFIDSSHGLLHSMVCFMK